MYNWEWEIIDSNLKDFILKDKMYFSESFYAYLSSEDNWGNPNVRFCVGYNINGSKISFITSRMGSITDNGSGGRYGYRMSKAALNIGAMSLAKDLTAEQIAVGIYHPGYVQTDMVNAAGATTNGDISAKVAAERLLNLMNELTMSESGVFKHSNGETLPW